MPHIRTIFPEREKEVIEILTNNGPIIRRALSTEFPRYPVEEIAIIPEPISDKVMAMADNLLPLEFVIDLGKQGWPLSNDCSERLRKTLIRLCPKLDKINFGIWIRDMSSNGFTEHKPVG